MKVDFLKIKKYIIGLHIFTATLLCYFFVQNMLIAEIILTLLCIVTCIFFRKSIPCTKTLCLWIAAIIVSVVSNFKSVDFQTSFSQVILLSYFLVMSTFVSLDTSDNKYLINILWFSCGLHVIFSLWQYFDNITFYSFLGKFANAERLAESLEIYRRGRLCGITDQTGINGFFISIFMIINMSKLLKAEKHKLQFLIMLIVALFILFNTGKRAFTLTTIAICICMWLINGNQMTFRKKIKNLGIGIVILIIIGWLVVNYGVADSIISKFQYLALQGDVTNGRGELWRDTLEIFDKHRFFGVGIRSIPLLLGDATHNVYVQLLAEVGIVGAGIFYCAMLYPFIKSCYVSIREKKLSLKRLVAISVQLFFLVYCITGNPLYDHKMMWIYAVAVGFAESEEKYGKQQS